MMHDTPQFRRDSRSAAPELMDDLSLHSAALGQNLRELALVNRYLGGHAVLGRGLKQLARSGFFAADRTYRIADVGAGGGDNVQYMVRWLARRGIRASVVGIDANAYMVDYARKACTAAFRRKPPAGVQWSMEQGDAFALGRSVGDTPFDLVTCSLFCHHFTDAQLVTLFGELSRATRGALLVNDLHRHVLAYWSIWGLTRLLRGSYLVQHDAPLSVARAFRRMELVRLLEGAVVTRGTVRVHWCWAFRWLAMVRLGGRVE